MNITYTTVTLYLHKNYELYFYEVLRDLDNLSIETDYIYDYSKLVVSRYNNTSSDKINLNVPLELYLKFLACYRRTNGYELS
jgi:hypothetical protein